MKATRREFLTAAVAITATTAVGQTESKLASDPMRPQFHLLPAKNWMNDPNGPIYVNGKYHMFYQYSPHAAVWGDMSWYHSVSTDMIHWRHLPLAFEPTPNSPDSYGCFSGSAIQVGKRVYVVYTCTRESTKELATIRDGQDHIQESQCLAYSDDPMLVKWTKLPDPIVPRPPAGMDITGFRDPSAWKQGDWFYMTVGSGVARTGGCVLLYRSKDMKQWEYLHELTSGPWTGKKTNNPCDDGEMWECPEFFALDGAHVLIYSTLGKVFWESGALDTTTMKFTMKKRGELDWGAFYAPKTQLDAKGRRILWGWLPERRPESAMREAGWSGMMGLPRVMSLDPDGTLRLKIAPEIATLRRGAATRGDSATIQAATGELLYTGTKGKSFELSLGEWVHATYSGEKHTLTIEHHEIQLSPNDIPTVHAFVDGSVIEVILAERIGFTRRFYYTGTTAPDIPVRSTGSGTLTTWRIAPISSNRLT